MSASTTARVASLPVSARPGPAARRRGQRTPLTPLRVVPSAIESSGSAAFAGACLALLGLGLVALLLLNTWMAQGSFTLSALQKQSGVLADTQASLGQSIERQKAPGALAQRAAAMGMVPASSMAFIRLSDGAIVGVAEAATQKQAITVVTGIPAGAAGAGKPSSAATGASPAPTSDTGAPPQSLSVPATTP